MNKRLIDKLLDFSHKHGDEVICRLFKNDEICELVFNDLLSTDDCWEPEYFQSCIEFIKSLDFESLLTFYNYIINNNLGYLYWMVNANNDILFKISKFIINKHCTRDYRSLMETIEMNIDTTSIEKLRKKYIDFELSSFDTNEQMLSNYYYFYQELVKNNLLASIKLDDILNMKNSFYIKVPKNLEEEFKTAIQNADYKKIELLFKLISRIEITNLIIDYHFEGQPYDVLIDIEEMLRYQKSGMKVIDDKYIDLYLRILDLDNISFNNAIELHKKMKLIDIKSQFYDDYRKTLDNQYQDIKNSILNEETIKKYKSQNLTKKNNIPIYYLDGEKFYALVKSLGLHKFNIENGYFKNAADLPSFSIISNDNLSVFSESKDNINIIFSSFNPSQIVFTYPCDVGCDCYIINGQQPTSNVNKIYTKDELTNVLSSYNHIIYRNQNIDNNDELNNRLECPKVLGVCAYDEISYKELDFAKKYNLPIVLINTKSYKKPIYKKMDYASHVEEVNCLDYEYDVYPKIDVENKRRNKIKEKIYLNN